MLWWIWSFFLLFKANDSLQNFFRMLSDQLKCLLCLAIMERMCDKGFRMQAAVLKTFYDFVKTVAV